MYLDTHVHTNETRTKKKNKSSKLLAFPPRLAAAAAAKSRPDLLGLGGGGCFGFVCVEEGMSVRQI